MNSRSSCVLPVLAALAAGAGAAVTPGQVSDTHETFFREFVLAAKKDGVPGIRDLAHPQALACIHQDSVAYYDQMMASQVQSAVNLPATAEVTVGEISAVDMAESEQTLAEFGMFWPIRPTAAISVSFRSLGSAISGAPAGLLTQNIALARYDGKWRWVFLCQDADRRTGKAELGNTNGRQSPVVDSRSANSQFLGEADIQNLTITLTPSARPQLVRWVAS